MKKNNIIRRNKGTRTLKKNVSRPISRGITNRLAMISKTTVVKNREMFPNYYGSPDGKFFCNYITLNAGKPTSLPWLSGIAQHYDMFRIISLIVEYVPTCPTTSVGTVAIAFDYDTTDQLPTTMGGLTQNHNCKTANAWAPLTNKFDVNATTLRRFFVKEGSSQAEDRWSDAGCVYLGTEGYVGKPGNVFIHYTIELINPQEYLVPSGVEVDLKPISKDVPINKNTVVAASGSSIKIATPTSNSVSITGLDKGTITSWLQGTGLTNLNPATTISGTGIDHVGTTTEGVGGTTRLTTYKTNNNWKTNDTNTIHIDTSLATTLDALRTTLANVRLI